MSSSPTRAHLFCVVLLKRIERGRNTAAGAKKEKVSASVRRHPGTRPLQLCNRRDGIGRVSIECTSFKSQRLD